MPRVNQTEVRIVGLDKTAAAFKSVDAKINRLSGRMKDFNTRATGAARGVGAFAGALAGFAASAGVSRAIGQISDTLKVIDDLNDLAGRTSVKVQSLREWGHVFKQNGMSQEEANASIEQGMLNYDRLRRGVGRVTSELQKSNPALLKNLKGAKTFGEFMNRSFQAIEGAGDDAAKAGMARLLLNNPKVVAIAKKGNAAIRKEMIENRKRLGIVTDEEGEEVGNTGDAFDNLKASIEGVNTAIGIEFAKTFRPLVEDLDRFVHTNRELIKQKAGDLFRDIGEGLRATDWRHIGQGIGEVATAIGALSEAGREFRKFQKEVGDQGEAFGKWLGINNLAKPLPQSKIDEFNRSPAPAFDALGNPQGGGVGPQSRAGEQIRDLARGTRENANAQRQGTEAQNRLQETVERLDETINNGYRTGGSFGGGDFSTGGGFGGPTFRPGIRAGGGVRAGGSTASIGHSAPWSEREAYIRSEAAKRGLNPDDMVALARTEGAGRYSGDFMGGQYRSFGDFQLYTGGGEGNRFAARTGLDPRNPKTWKQQTQFALNRIVESGNTNAWYGPRDQGIRPRLNGNIAAARARGALRTLPIDMGGASRPPVDPDRMKRDAAPPIKGTGATSSAPGGPVTAELKGQASSNITVRVLGQAKIERIKTASQGHIRTNVGLDNTGARRWEPGVGAAAVG